MEKEEGRIRKKKVQSVGEGFSQPKIVYIDSLTYKN